MATGGSNGWLRRKLLIILYKWRGVAFSERENFEGILNFFAGSHV